MAGAAGADEVLVPDVDGQVETAIGVVAEHVEAEVVERGACLGFASVRAADGSVLAIARGSLDEGWLGVTAVEVEPSARRRGLAGVDVGERLGA